MRPAFLSRATIARRLPDVYVQQIGATWSKLSLRVSFATKIPRIADGAYRAHRERIITQEKHERTMLQR